jgi:hypothetical protein
LFSCACIVPAKSRPANDGKRSFFIMRNLKLMVYDESFRITKYAFNCYR